MAMLRRILKYSPAVVLGLLVVAWIAGLLGQLTVTYSRPGGANLTIESASATLGLTHVTSQPSLGGLPVENDSGARWQTSATWPGTRDLFGAFKTRRYQTCFGGVVRGVQVPLPVVAAALLPLAFGSLRSFRFRLWHYLAFTAIVAVELAYYLRWQG